MPSSRPFPIRAGDFKHLAAYIERSGFWYWAPESSEMVTDLPRNLGTMTAAFD